MRKESEGSVWQIYLMYSCYRACRRWLFRLAMRWIETTSHWCIIGVHMTYVTTLVRWNLALTETSLQTWTLTSCGISPKFVFHTIRTYYSAETISTFFFRIRFSSLALFLFPPLSKWSFLNYRLVRFCWKTVSPRSLFYEHIPFYEHRDFPDCEFHNEYFCMKFPNGSVPERKF